MDQGTRWGNKIISQKVPYLICPQDDKDLMPLTKNHKNDAICLVYDSLMGLGALKVKLINTPLLILQFKMPSFNISLKIKKDENIRCNFQPI